jgi:glycosyltransferase involved in cell wall biosynthesis
MKDLVSIITPTFNCAKFIEETIKSVQSQTYINWEMLIVDDASTDSTEEIVKSIIEFDKRIKYIKLDENCGAAKARNIAMTKSEGRYMAFLDSDDIWDENKLEKQLRFMKENKYAITNTSYSQIDEAGNQLKKVIKALEATDYNRLLLDCPVGNSTVMYDVYQLGKFEVPNIRKRNDDALWLMMLKKEKYIFGLNEVLMKYRIRSGSISKNKFDLIKYHWYLYRKIEKLSIFRSLLHIIIWMFIKVLRIK